MVRILEGMPPRGGLLNIEGAPGSLPAVMVAALHEALPERVLAVVVPEPERVRAVEADLDTLLGEDIARVFPQRERSPFEVEGDPPEVEGLRVEALEGILAGASRLLVTSPRAVQERFSLSTSFEELKLRLTVEEEIPFQELLEALEERGYRRVPLVEEVGQFAVRGGLVDVFSLGLSDPVRIEFWGDEVSSIRLFDVLDQRSHGELEGVELLPTELDLADEDETTAPSSLSELLPPDTVMVELGSVDWDAIFRKGWEQARQAHHSEGGTGVTLEQVLVPPEEARDKVTRLPRIRVPVPENGEVDLGGEPPPPVNRDMDRLAARIREASARGMDTLILCDNQGQLERMEEILQDAAEVGAAVRLAVGSLEGGFRLPGGPSPLQILTDHEIFRRSRRLKRRRRFQGAVALESVAQLTPGDYIVHMDHGIGRFLGLDRTQVAGEELEALAVEYAGGEVLRVPVYRLDLVERWVGEADDAEPPSVHRIGGKRWKTLRKKTEESIETMAAELLELYADRELSTGFAYSKDTRWQREMESAFLFEDTPDQRSATQAVKKDMESPRPMDRLICGDVGYGKTEVAIRAAFKAVQDGKQVAVLAPTTVLVEQHRRTFQERLADFPVRVEALSRFRSAGERKDILLGLEEGAVDIVVGTHRLLSSDVGFRNLGLLVVDEEQRFGVRHKERLKQLRTSVDVLTLTATPIPRTLQLSLGGLRDLSLIRTPPRDRLPVATQAVAWSNAFLAEAMGRELDRGGQVFFLHNRVETIHTMEERVRRILPEARTAVAHGQMSGKELDVAMRSFVEGDVDVLVCSAIIENGLDVPNANTLVVNDAHRFGLSQLYQIRGRVGRSDRRAYCYLVIPEALTDDARQRIKILEHHTELGSGYHVALKDLELRGAGNLLGSSQSGFAHAVGMDTYLRLMEDTVRKLKARKSGREEYPEPEVSLSGSAYLPDGYVSDSSQKLHLYRRLAKLEEEHEIRTIRTELEDRYGPLPTEAERLLEAHALRILGTALGVDRIFVREREGRLTFREGVVPRIMQLDEPFGDRQVAVTVRRMDPLSLSLRQEGPEPLTSTLIRALTALADGRQQAA